LKGRSKPDITAEFLLNYIGTAFLPIFNELSSLEEFADEDAVLLMSNCLSHVTGEVLDLL
jgi:hypothetical protein